MVIANWKVVFNSTPLNFNVSFSQPKKQSHYCSKDCQIKDWNLAHKLICASRTGKPLPSSDQLTQKMEIEDAQTNNELKEYLTKLQENMKNQMNPETEKKNVQCEKLFHLEMLKLVTDLKNTLKNLNRRNSSKRLR